MERLFKKYFERNRCSLHDKIMSNSVFCTALTDKFLIVIHKQKKDFSSSVVKEMDEFQERRSALWKRVSIEMEGSYKDEF